MELLLLKPTSAISKSKSPKGMNATMEILMASWGMIALALFIITGSLPLMVRVGFSFVAFAVGVLSTIFYGFLLQVIITNLSGRGQFYHGVTALTFAKFQVAVGILIACVLLHLGILGVFLAVITSLFFVMNAISTLFRAVKEFFAVDTLTSLIGIGILVAGTVITFYAILIGTFTVNQGNFLNYFSVF